MAKNREPWVKCPACKDKLMPPKHGICEGCKSLIADGKRWQESLRRQSRVTLGLPSPHGEISDLQICHTHGEPAKRLINAFMAVIYALCKRTTGHFREHKEQLFACSYVLEDGGSFVRGVPDKLRELRDAIEEALAFANKEGEADGANLLKRLAAGEATIHEFNEATIGREP